MLFLEQRFSAALEHRCIQEYGPKKLYHSSQSYGTLYLNTHHTELINLCNLTTKLSYVYRMETNRPVYNPFREYKGTNIYVGRKYLAKLPENPQITTGIVR